MEQTSGKTLGYFFDQWLHGLGYPIFSGKWNQMNDNVSVLLSQTTSNPATTLFKTSVDIRLYYTGGDTLIKVWFDTISKNYSFYLVGKAIKNIVIDPNDRILNGIGTFTHDPLYNAIADVNGVKNNFTIYPNPVGEQLNLVNATGCFIEVLDVTGKIILSKHVYEINSMLDVSELNSGLYFIRIEKNGAVSNLKFVKE